VASIEPLNLVRARLSVLDQRVDLHIVLADDKKIQAMLRRITSSPGIVLLALNAHLVIVVVEK